METIGARLKKIRQQKGLSLRELAKQAHMSHSFIADIEAGRSNPSLDTLQALAKALNVSISTLIGENEDRPTNDYLLGRTSNPAPNGSKLSLEEEFPEVANVLRRSGKRLTPEDRKRIARIIKAAIEDVEE